MAHAISLLGWLKHVTCLSVLQAKAAMQTIAATEAKAELLCLTQQEKEVTGSIHRKEKEVKTTQKSIEDLQDNKSHVESELRALLDHVPELHDMLAR